MKAFRPGLLMLALAGALLTSTTALAGFKTAQPVVIEAASSFANGDLGYVRNTPDGNQYIGCYSYSNVAGCYAVDSTGHSAGCFTSDADLVATVRSLNGDSYLYFSWDTSGRCNFIEVQSDSTTAPKT